MQGITKILMKIDHCVSTILIELHFILFSRAIICCKNNNIPNYFESEIIILNVKTNDTSQLESIIVFVIL